MKDYLSTTGDFVYPQQDYDDFKNRQAGKRGIAHFRLNTPGPPTIRAWTPDFAPKDWANADAEGVDIIDVTGLQDVTDWLAGDKLYLDFFFPLSVGGPGIQRRRWVGGASGLNFSLRIVIVNDLHETGTGGIGEIEIAVPGGEDADSSIQNILRNALIGAEHAGRIAWATSDFGTQAHMQALGLQISDGSNNKKITIKAPANTGGDGNKIWVRTFFGSNTGALVDMPSGAPPSAAASSGWQEPSYLTGGRDLLKEPDKLYKISLGAFKSSCT